MVAPVLCKLNLAIIGQAVVDRSCGQGPSDKRSSDLT